MTSWWTVALALLSAVGSLSGAARGKDSGDYYDCQASHAIWRQPVVTYAVICQAGADPKTVAAEKQMVADAIGEWAPALVGRTIVFRIATTGGPKPDVTIAFVPKDDVNLGWDATGKIRAVGETLVSFAGETTIAAASCWIDADLGDEIEHAVAVHELGHALGILTHSDEEDDAMFPSYHLPGDVTRRDLATMRRLYR